MSESGRLKDFEMDMIFVNWNELLACNTKLVKYVCLSEWGLVQTVFLIVNKSFTAVFNASAKCTQSFELFVSTCAGNFVFVRKRPGRTPQCRWLEISLLRNFPTCSPTSTSAPVRSREPRCFKLASTMSQTSRPSLRWDVVWNGWR